MQHILAIKLSYGLVWNLNTRSAVGLKCLGDSSVECGIFYLILISFFYISPTRPSRLWSQFKFEESAPFFGTFKWQKCPRWTSHTGYLLPASCLQPALWSLQWVRPLQWSNPIICPIKPVVFFFFFFLHTLLCNMLSDRSEADWTLHRIRFNFSCGLGAGQQNCLVIEDTGTETSVGGAKSLYGINQLSGKTLGPVVALIIQAWAPKICSGTNCSMKCPRNTDCNQWQGYYSQLTVVVPAERGEKSNYK